MKKLAAALVAVLLAFGLGACGQKQQDSEAVDAAYDLYTKANEAFAASPSMAADMTMEMTLSMGGESMALAMRMAMQEAARGETDVDMALQTQTEYDGMQMEMNMYYTGGWLYMDALGTKVKAPMDIGQVPQQNTYNVAFSVEAIKEASVQQVGGGQQLGFTLDGAMMGEAMREMLLSSLGGDARADIGDVGLTAFVDDAGELKNLSMQFDINVLSAGQSMRGSVQMSMDNIQIGDVSVEFPPDLDSYTETDMADLPVA